MFREDRPVKRLMRFQGHLYYIAIHKKCIGKDTSVFGGEDSGEESGICFFPTEITELHYNVLEVDPTHKRRDEMMLEMGAEEETIRLESQKARGEREHAEWLVLVEQCKSMDYTGFFEHLASKDTHD